MDRDARRWMILEKKRHSREKRELESRLRSEFLARELALKARYEQRERDLEQRLKGPVDEIVRRFSRVEFDRFQGGGERYAMRLDFDARLMGGYSRREDMELLAERIAYQVEREIASCRFMQSARDLERERRYGMEFPPR